MPDSLPFVDYYEVLQVNPNCDIKIIESAYRHFAKIFHPDHAETADSDRFTAVIEAYNILKFPDKRAAYDVVYNSNTEGRVLSSEQESHITEETAISDAETQKNILLYLYRRKRENFRDHGVAGFYIQQMFSCSDDTLDFHTWYLKSKGYVEITEQGTLSITVEGVDHILSMHQPRTPERLLPAHTPEAG
ncbi:MAG: DnaJ domain-containing protein [Sphingomonadales bacterium]|nr:DnaJ domain-containing protein [Sphingomonadales bacterium]